MRGRSPKKRQRRGMTAAVLGLRPRYNTDEQKTRLEQKDVPPTLHSESGPQVQGKRYNDGPLPEDDARAAEENGSLHAQQDMQRRLGKLVTLARDVVVDPADAEGRSWMTLGYSPNGRRLALGSVAMYVGPERVEDHVRRRSMLCHVFFTGGLGKWYVRGSWVEGLLAPMQ